jgi:hypothetical protein
MIFLSIGLPSRFAEWCDGVICTIVHTAIGSFHVESGNTLDEIARAVLKSRAPRLVIGARQPSEDLRVALAEMGTRFVLALDDPYAAFYNLVARHGLEWKTAIRATASSCALTLGYQAMPGALVVHASREGLEPIATARMIARWFNIDLDNPAIATAVRGSDPDFVSARQEFQAWWSRISTSDRAVVDGALGGYIEQTDTGRMGQITWARDLFSIGDEPDTAADRAIEISGPIRNLLFGPYITLPCGHWHITAVLAVSHQGIDMPFSMEVLAGPSCICLARGMAEPRTEGIAEISAEFIVSECTAQPISVRVANLRPARIGRLALGHVTLTPRPKPATEIPAELRAALGLPDRRIIGR